MRVISKLGEDDIPYELSVFWRDETVIWAIIPGFGKIIMAQYSSQGKAEKAMQMLHEAYTGAPFIVNNVEVPEGFDEQLKNMISGFITVVDHGDNVRIEPMNIVFRFPQDDEINTD